MKKLTEQTVIPSEYLVKKDPVLGRVIEQIILPPLIKPESHFVDLVESIVSQQLSVKAADTIYKRFEVLFPKNKVTAEYVLGLSDDAIRAVGISYSKISYIKNLAKHVLESGLIFEQFEIMTDEEIITELTKVKGIGRWTAEMFLMFGMGRPDIFSYGDLGLKNAIQKLYGFETIPTLVEAEKIAEKWRPYRTVASRYLWKSLEL